MGLYTRVVGGSVLVSHAASWSRWDVVGSKATASENARLQTAFARHNKRVNVIYVDGHAAPSLPSALTWGQFFGVFTPGVAIKTSPSTPISSVQSDDHISTPAYDALEWSSAPE